MQTFKWSEYVGVNRRALEGGAGGDGPAGAGSVGGGVRQSRGEPGAVGGFLRRRLRLGLIDFDFDFDSFFSKVFQK